MKKNYSIKALISVLFIMIFAVCFSKQVNAKTLDEIVDYRITVDVLNDATLDIRYDIAWKVLDSQSEGPLSWVKIGIPNKHCNLYEPISNNIKSIVTDYSGGSYVKIYLDREYYKDEIVKFSYKLNMDNMYVYDPEKGYADYSFTPGWFDEIAVDNLTLRWNYDKIDRFIPSCEIIDGYNVWNTSLKPGEKFTVTVTYPGDAFSFVVFENESDGHDFSKSSLVENITYVIGVILGLAILFMIIVAPVAIPVLVIYGIYKSATGFSSGTEKKITRTVIEFYPSCPNCGGTRKEGEDTCEYCGSSMIRSKQEIKEEDAQKNHKDLLKYNEKGVFQDSDNPNRYVRVNIVNVPRPVSRTTSSHHSSCAHSSCACACACACAGGGRAGCTTKDFYNTDLKLRHIKKVVRGK